MNIIKRAGLLVIAVLFSCSCQEDSKTVSKHDSNRIETPADKKVPANKPPYHGHTLNKAKTLAAKQGYILRVMRIDGENFAGTTDYVENRLDVAVENGIIVAW